MFTPQQIAQFKQDLTINTTLLGHPLSLASRWGVFSPREIDEGTQLLLRHIDISPNDTCLDLGCGYGAIGIALAKCAIQGYVYLVDKDFTAIELAQKNIASNNLSNAQALLSDGFSHVDNRIRFDQIVSNLPAKVGREQLSIFLFDAYLALNTGGRITVVTINGLRQFIKTNFTHTFGNYKKLKQGARYTVSQAIKT